MVALSNEKLNMIMDSTSFLIEDANLQNTNFLAKISFAIIIVSHENGL